MDPDMWGTLWTGLLLPVLKGIVKRVLYEAFSATFKLLFSLQASKGPEMTLSCLLYLVLFWTSLQNEITAADKQALRTLTRCSHSYSVGNQLWIYQFPRRRASHISSEINKSLYKCERSISKITSRLTERICGDSVLSSHKYLFTI